MAATKDQIIREMTLMLGRAPTDEELAAIKAAADRMQLGPHDAGLQVMILRAEALQLLRYIVSLLLCRDEGFLDRLERRIPWALLALVAIVALAFGYVIGAQG
ncbi:hypothetical protein [Shinella sp.]|uniref:hypothetical protein n=1 Tax=Shinella sp. TaxID=1870904 RepID=UPI003F71A7E6